MLNNVFGMTFLRLSLKNLILHLKHKNKTPSLKLLLRNVPRGDWGRENVKVYVKRCGEGSNLHDISKFNISLLRHPAVLF